jgi:hypothetical protein
MRTARYVLLASLLISLGAGAAQAAWPSLFSSKGKESSASTADSFWKSERPNFGTPLPPRTRPEPPKPTVWSRMGSSSKRMYNNTAGRVGMPKIKSKPVSVTGHHTPWTRPKAKPESSGGMFSWFQSKPAEPARSTDEFFSLKRPE